VDRLAQRPGADDRAYEFPIARIAPESLDFSFSGLKTSLLYAVRGTPVRGGTFERDHTWLSESSKADLAASFQRAAVAAVVLKVGRALERMSSGGGARSLLVGGGVSANSRLRDELGVLARARGLLLVKPEMEFCVDNAAMIAGLACALHGAGRVSSLDLQAEPTSAL
jgi:N6-L-threonylcarbamoyladenine synthase